MFDGLYTDGFVVSPYIDYTKSRLEWSIGASSSLNSSPNILSELRFGGQKSRGWGVDVAYLKKLNDKWALYIEGGLLSSRIRSGEVQDSDYDGNNRTQEFSRSVSSTGGDGIERKELSGGFKYRWFNTKGHYIGILAGKQYFNYDTTISDGIQLIPEQYFGQPITGLRSTYKSSFDSTFAAVSSEHVFKWGTLGLRYEVHDVEFDAKGDWNLRPLFAHPVSFAQTAEGDSKVLVLGYSYAINKFWDIYANWTKRRINVSNGYDHTFFKDGTSAVTRLNNVDFKAISTQAGFRYFF